jgi:hypothetical protein
MSAFRYQHTREEMREKQQEMRREGCERKLMAAEDYIGTAEGAWRIKVRLLLGRHAYTECIPTLGEGYERPARRYPGCHGAAGFACLRPAHVPHATPLQLYENRVLMEHEDEMSRQHRQFVKEQEVRREREAKRKAMEEKIRAEREREESEKKRRQQEAEERRCVCV